MHPSLYKTLVCPSVKDFRWAIQTNQIWRCPVTVEDIDVATCIWGKDGDVLKGKTTRSKPETVARDQIKIPWGLLKLHRNVHLMATFSL